MKLVWFRSDLRINDNPALSYACNQSKPVRAVVCVCEKQWRKHGLGDRRILLMQQAIDELKISLAKLNIELSILNSGSFAQSIIDVQQHIQIHQISELLFNIEYELNERQRDKQMLKWCAAQQVQVNRFHDQCLLAPGEVLNGSQEYYKVFTPFKKRYAQMLGGHLTPPLASPEPQSQNPTLTIVEVESGTTQADALWPVSEAQAHQQLEEFLQENAKHYHSQRDTPSLDATSKLSTYLALGLLSTRQCFYSAYQMNKHEILGGNEGLATWMSELIWRDFYRHLLIGFPQLCKHKAFKPETEAVKWQNDEANFNAWCEGKTGYPLVDAAILQLLETGWMHNRLRMVCAMFLTKHLLIDWRKGEAFFNQHLVDADFASNNGGWQWSASTGADAVPYFRIFNPITQSQRFDKDCLFIRRYLPELSNLSNKDIHFPSEQQRQDCNYPQAIVDPKQARERALAAFKEL